MEEGEARHWLGGFGYFDGELLQHPYRPKAKLHQQEKSATEIILAFAALKQHLNETVRRVEQAQEPASCTANLPVVRETRELTTYLAASEAFAAEKQEREVAKASQAMRRAVVLPSISSRNRFSAVSAFLLALVGITKISIPPELIGEFPSRHIAAGQFLIGLAAILAGLVAIIF